MPKTIKTERDVIRSGPLHRSFVLDRASVDAEKRTISLSFSSETDQVERWFGIEILDHSPGAVSLDRLNNGGPLLDNHDPDEVIGVVESALIAPDRKGRAIVRFGKGAEADEVFQDVLDGIRRHVSVGYRVMAMVLEKTGEGAPDVYRVTEWEPFEVSIVAIPADLSVGVGRGEAENIKNNVTIIKKKERAMGEENKDQKKTEEQGARSAVAVDENAVRATVLKEERQRIAEIGAIAKRHNVAEIGQKFIEEGKSVEDFRKAVLEGMGAKPVAERPEVGMTPKDIREYSLLRALNTLAEGRPLDGLEREVSDETAKRCRREARGFFIPQDVMTAKRALNATDSTKGGFTVDTDVLGGSLIELLRNKTVVSTLGARSLSGLVGNIAIPKVTGGATAYWLAEDGTVTASDQAFAQLGLSPKRLVGDTAYNKQLLAQSSIDVEGFVREDLMKVLAIAKDLAAINGLGAAGQPKGILNTTGIGSVTFGAAATFAKMVAFETALAAANADLGKMAYLTTPAVRGKLKTAPKVSNYPVFIWESGEVNGYRAEATNQVPSDKVIFGNWDDLIMADWAGIDVVVDPYSQKKQGQVEVTITLMSDIGVRHEASFCASTDSGAQ